MTDRATLKARADKAHHEIKRHGWTVRRAMKRRTLYRLVKQYDEMMRERKRCTK